MIRKKAEKKSRPAASITDSPKIAAANLDELPKKVVAEDLVSRRERIALLAYSFWQQRGCPNGSPDEDWYRAEQELDSASAR